MVYTSHYSCLTWVSGFALILKEGFEYGLLVLVVLIVKSNPLIVLADFIPTADGSYLTDCKITCFHLSYLTSVSLVFPVWSQTNLNNKVS